MKPYRIGKTDSGKEFYIIVDREGVEHSGLVRTGEMFEPPIFEDVDGIEQVVGVGPEEEIVEIRWPVVRGIRPHIRGKAGSRYWSGRWVYEVQIGGKSKTRYFDNFEDAVQVKLKVEEKAKDEAADAVYRAAEGLTVSNAVALYLRDCKDVENFTAGTMKYKDRILQGFSAYFPKKMLSSLLVSDVKRFLDSKADKDAPHRWNRYRREVNALFNYAVIKWSEKVGRNPVSKIKAQSVGKSRKPNTVTEAVFEKVLAHAKGLDNSQPYNLLVAYRDTWGRQKEVMGWTLSKHVDFEAFDGAGGVLMVSKKSKKEPEKA